MALFLCQHSCMGMRTPLWQENHVPDVASIAVQAMLESVPWRKLSAQALCASSLGGKLASPPSVCALPMARRNGSGAWARNTWSPPERP